MKIYFLAVLEARSLRSESQKIRFLVRGLLLAGRWLSPVVSLHGRFSVRTENSLLSLPLPVGTPVLLYSGFALITSGARSSSLKALSLRKSHWGVRTLIYKFWGGCSSVNNKFYHMSTVYRNSYHWWRP